MLSRFFIDRPIFASVLSIVITLAGGISVFTLPLAQFPQVTPPTVQVTCNYPGASALEVADSVAAPIEQQVNGVEGIMYMNSQCANDGSYSLTVTFQHGVDIDMATVLVQNRVNLAVPLLPEVIRQTGVTTRKRSPDILMGMALTSPNDRYDQLLSQQFRLDAGERRTGPHARSGGRVPLRPARLQHADLGRSGQAGQPGIVCDRRRARCPRTESPQVATEAPFGQEPMYDGQMSQITPLSTLGRLSEPGTIREHHRESGAQRPNDFTVRSRTSAGSCRISNAKNQDIRVRIDGHDTVFLAIFQTPGRQCVIDSAGPAARPKWTSSNSHFLTVSITDIGFRYHPLHERVDQGGVESSAWTRSSWCVAVSRAAVFAEMGARRSFPWWPCRCAIIGTFAVMAAIGFSLQINLGRSSASVLAIGIVVDDAIVVVEAVEHHIYRERIRRRAQATIAAMRQGFGGRSSR